MADRTCNVFISHIHEDDHRLQPLKDTLADHGCKARDYSINSDKPNRAKSADYIKQEILKPQIDKAGTVVVLISPETKDSEYVQWEIEYARKEEKRIVGIWDEGESECDLPEGLEDYADALVPWNGERMAAAILGEEDPWCDAEGTPLPERELVRPAGASC